MRDSKLRPLPLEVSWRPSGRSRARPWTPTPRSRARWSPPDHDGDEPRHAGTGTSTSLRRRGQHQRPVDTTNSFGRRFCSAVGVIDDVEPCAVRLTTDYLGGAGAELHALADEMPVVSQ